MHYHELVSNARMRGIPCTITREQWDGLVSSGHCHYCHRRCPPGIDRLDNSVGYVLGNCVPCCTRCNLRKSDQSVESLLAKLGKLPARMLNSRVKATAVQYGVASLILAIPLLGCGIRGYHWASHGPGDTSAGDVTHATEYGARVVVPNSLPFSPAEVTESTGECDKTLWAHVYHPDRLKVINPCVTVTGTIVDATHGKRRDGQRHESDADNHGWLKLDSQVQGLLISGNNAAEDGNMVFECVCQYGTPKQVDAKPACKGFKSSVKIPPVGSHVAITGSLVEDEDHQPIHREIHPVTKIVVIK